MCTVFRCSLMNKAKNRKWKNTVAPIPINSSSLPRASGKLNLFKSKLCVSCCHEGVESCWTVLNWTRRTRSAPNHNELDYTGSCSLRQLKWNWFETPPSQATQIVLLTSGTDISQQDTCRVSALFWPNEGMLLTWLRLVSSKVQALKVTWLD